MATFFGEVILPSSRVFFDENEEDSDIEEELSSGTRNLEMKIHDGSSLKDEYELLLVVEGIVSRGFADIYLLNEKIVSLAEIYLPKIDDKDNLVEITPHRKESSVLYKLNNNTLLLKTSPSVDLTLANQLTLKISPWLAKCKRIIVFCTKAVWEYRCENADNLPPSFERTLATSSVKEVSPLYHFLEQPNFLTGFSASVTSWCECKGKPCILHVNYTDKQVLDSITLAPLLKLFDSANLSHLMINKCLDTSKLGISCDQSFMYM